MSANSDEQLWSELCAADDRYFEARMALVQRAGDLDGIIGRALDKPSERGAALRVMKILPEERVRLHLQQLARLASVGHSDIALVRDVMMTKMDRRWLVENLDRHVEPILAKAEDEEEFRRIAELYQQLDPDLLKTHLARCASHANEEVREIASDSASQANE
jgi:hypothetical protein